MASIAQSCNAALPNRGAVDMQKLLEDVRLDLDSLRVQFNQLRTDYNAHVHGGVTAGAGNTAAPTATTAAAVTLKTAA